MTRLIHVGLILMLSSVMAQGQTHFLGLKGGVNLSNVSSDGFLNDSQKRIAFAGGLTYQYNPSASLTFGADLVLAQRGTTDQIELLDGTGAIVGTAKAKFNYDYLSIALKGGYASQGDLRVFANFGFAPAWLVDAKTITPRVNGGEDIVDVTDMASSFDLIGIVETGVQYELNDQFLMFSSLEYQHGFLTVSNTDYFDGSDIKHRSIGLSVGFRYALN